MKIQIVKNNKKRTQNKSSKKHSKQNPLHRITTKNISSKVKNGTILQTRDEFFEGQSNYRKPDYEEKGNYRKAVVIDSNRKAELAVVKLTTKGNSYYVFPRKDEKIDVESKYYKQSKLKHPEKSKYRPFIEIFDDENKPIKISSKFVYVGEYIHKKLANDIKENSITKPGKREIQDNRQKLKKLKNR